jgi:hypothetical protein
VDPKKFLSWLILWARALGEFKKGQMEVEKEIKEGSQ